MDVDALIAAIHVRPPVWDKRMKLYSNRTAVDGCWKEIAAEIQIDETAARKKWKYLRDNFAVEYGKWLQSRSGDADDDSNPPSTKWQYFHKLMFLREMVTPRASSHSHQPSVNSHFQNTEPDFAKDETGNGDSPLPCLEESEGPVHEIHKWEPQHRETQELNITGPIVPNLNRRKRCCSCEYYSKLLDIEEKKAQHLYKKPKRAADEEDNDLMFFKTLLPHVRSISQRMRLQFQSEIQAVVQKYAYPPEETILSPSH